MVIKLQTVIHLLLHTGEPKGRTRPLSKDG